MDKVRECICPLSDSCRGCSHSYYPDLYDGGCMLHYAGQGDGESLQAEESENGAQDRVNLCKF